MTNNNLPSYEEQQDFYDKLRARLVRFTQSKKGKNSRFIGILLFVPDLFHLLVKAMFDKNINAKNKMLIGAGIAYFMLPLDFMPEAIFGFGGFVDDIVIATFVINTLINQLGIENMEKHWSGDAKLLAVLQKISAKTEQFTEKIPVKSLLARFMRDSKQQGQL